jgi:hypothetical protein
VERHYSPEAERYPDKGIRWTGQLRHRTAASRMPYIVIPKAAADHFGIMVDDEISVSISDTEHESEEEYYHVSKMGKSFIVVLSKLKKREKDGGTPVLTRMTEKIQPDARDPITGETRDPVTGVYAEIVMKAHPGTGRKDLCWWADSDLKLAETFGVKVLRPSLDKDLKPL